MYRGLNHRRDSQSSQIGLSCRVCVTPLRRDPCHCCCCGWCTALVAAGNKRSSTAFTLRRNQPPSSNYGSSQSHACNSDRYARQRSAQYPLQQPNKLHSNIILRGTTELAATCVSQQAASTSAAAWVGVAALHRPTAGRLQSMKRTHARQPRPRRRGIQTHTLLAPARQQQLLQADR